MGAQIPAQAAAAMASAPASLEALHRLAQERINTIVHDHAWMWYPPVALRYHAVTRLIGPVRQQQETELRLDLQAILDAAPETLKNMVMHQSTTVACMPPKSPDAAALEALAVANAMRPGPSAVELIQRFAAQGVTITALGDNLHVQPGDRLTEDDRALLRSQKPAILRELGRGGVVL